MSNNFKNKKWGSIFDFLNLINTLVGMKERSKTIFNCTSHLSALSEDLYEDLHDGSGNPVDPETAKLVVASYMKSHQDEINTILEA
jgi:hypothetical protein